MLFKFNKYILIAVTSVIIIVAPMFDLSWNYVLRDYHKKRIETYLSGFNADPTDSGYQVRQSIIAVGAGQLNGRGYLKGTQSTLKNLPFAHTDFIFAALAEQFGFLGVTALFGIYSILIGRLFILASKITDQFSKILVTGVISLITINIFVNTAMNLGLIPVTGVPLPLISHGGSSVLVIMISLGLIQMVNNSVNSKDLTEKFVWRI